MSGERVARASSRHGTTREGARAFKVIFDFHQKLYLHKIHGLLPSDVSAPEISCNAARCNSDTVFFSHVLDYECHALPFQLSKQRERGMNTPVVVVVVVEEPPTSAVGRFHVLSDQHLALALAAHIFEDGGGDISNQQLEAALMCTVFGQDGGY